MFTLRALTGIHFSAKNLSWAIYYFLSASDGRKLHIICMLCYFICIYFTEESNKLGQVQNGKFDYALIFSAVYFA